MTFDQITWLPVCVGLTGLGLVLSFLAFRRRGLTAGLRTTAWALLPLAAYLTNALRTLWNIGSSVVSFVTGLVLSPTVWAGVAVAGVSAVLFVVSGRLRGRALAKARDGGPEPVSGPADTTKPMLKPTSKPTAKPAAKPAEKAPKNQSSDEFGDIEDILKKHGIN